MSLSMLTVREAVEQWLGRGAGNWSTNTQHIDRLGVASHILPALGRRTGSGNYPVRRQHWVGGVLAEQHRRAIVAFWTYVLSGAPEKTVRLGVVTTNPESKVRRPSVTT